MDKYIEDLIYKNFSGSQRERALKVLTCTDNVRDRRMFFKNYFIKVKSRLRKSFKNIALQFKKINIYNGKLIKAKSENNLKRANKFKENILQCKKNTLENGNYINITGEFLFTYLPECEGLFTDNEIAEFFSCSKARVQEARRIYEDSKDKEEPEYIGFLLSAICIFGIEYKPGFINRKKGIKDCNTFDVPFFAAINFYIDYTKKTAIS